MKVTSNKSVSFPKLNWGISKGEERELPEDKEAQARILSEDGIQEVGVIINKTKVEDTK